MPKEQVPKNFSDLTTCEGLISFDGADVRVRDTSDFFVLVVDPAASGSQYLAGCGSAKPCSGSGS